jgi:hypothetical protein
MAASCFPNFFGFTSFYVFLVTIACSQLEKLRANLLDIRQKPDTSEQDSGTETDREEEETQVHTSQEVFRRMQKQLNCCIRHHQDILKYVTQEGLLIVLSHYNYKNNLCFSFRYSTYCNKEQ